ncbi:hypothetical protein KY336_00105 [Candidatus Woesearchaeota archaeon]|nr:hypothetical protein [Candidatus Woesearchaeota archaeon]
MQKLMLVVSIIVVLMFLVSCAPMDTGVIEEVEEPMMEEPMMEEQMPPPAEEIPMEEPIMVEEPMEEPMMEEEVAEEEEESMEGMTEIEKFVNTAKKTYGEPFERGATNDDQPPQFLLDIAAEDRFGFELGYRIRRWWVGFDDILSIEHYGSVAIKDSKQIVLPIKPTSNLIFKNTPVCVGNPNCGDIPFAYQWDRGEVTFLYCPMSMEICQTAKRNFIDRYS